MYTKVVLSDLSSWKILVWWVGGKRGIWGHDAEKQRGERQKLWRLG